MSWFYELLSVNRSIARAKEELAELKRQIAEARATRAKVVNDLNLLQSQFTEQQVSSDNSDCVEKHVNHPHLLNYDGELKDLRKLQSYCIDMYDEFYGSNENTVRVRDKARFVLRKANIALQNEKKFTSAPLVIESLQNEVTVLTERLRAVNELLVDEINKTK